MELKHIGLNANFLTCPPKIEDLFTPQIQEQVSAYCWYQSGNVLQMDGILDLTSANNLEAIY